MSTEPIAAVAEEAKPPDPLLVRRNPRAVILTALDEEYLAVKEHLNGLREVVHALGNVYEIGSFQGQSQKWDVLIGAVGTGNQRSAIGADRAIGYFHPDVIIFVGIAGGVKDVDLCDVVIADKAYGYESGKAMRREVLARPELGASSFRILERAKAEARKSDWKNRVIGLDHAPDSKAIVKPIASGEKVIASQRSSVCRQIKRNYSDTVAVEMEAVGFFQATQMNSRTEALIVRGISDLLDKKKEADEAGVRIKAAKNASAFAFQVLFKFTQPIEP